MKSLKLYSTLVILLAFYAFAHGQTKSISNAYLAKQFSFYENTDANLNHRNFFEVMSKKMHLSAQTEMVLSAEVKGENGYVHYKYKQLYDGIPVFGNTYILHEKDGALISAGGQYSSQVPASTRPSFDANAALAMVKKAMGAVKYADKKPVPTLCFIDPVFPKSSEALLLAYQIDLVSTSPYDKRRMFVDARSGKVISSFPLILQEGVPSTGKTRYYGTRNIITDSLGPQQFVLHDPTRGQGITVSDGSGINFTNTSSTWDLTNDDMDEVALDAHFCTQEFYDLMLEQFGWDGLDDNGKALEAWVHDSGAGAVNAYWDGQFTHYGDGNCLYGPLTTLEVVGHEFTHGVIDYTSNLVYNGESGAINESLADMFGKILERNVDPTNFSWVLSHSFLLSPDAAPFRIMNDPASLDMPDYYKGSLWDDGADVHTNSSIGNLWFTMIVDGKQGVNEAGTPYIVPAIGIDKAGQIVFKVNTAYFTESSNYPQFAQFSVQAAEELYGAGSATALAVAEAWKAVGVTGAPPSSVLNLSVVGSFQYFQTCGVNEFVPISVQIANQGGIAYTPSMNAILTISEDSGNQPDYTMPLTEPLAPGEVLNLTIDDWFMPSDIGFYFVNTDLLFSDTNEDDNYGYSFYDIGETANNMELYVFADPQLCFTSSIEGTVYILNNSCEQISAGTAVTITAEDDNGLVFWTLPYALANDLAGFGGISFLAQIPLTSNSSTVIFKLLYAADVNNDNNEFYSNLTSITPITTDYLNNFNADISQDNTLGVIAFEDNPLIVYNGNSYFGSTGLESDPEFITHCPEYTDNFNNSDNYSGVNSTIRTCVDFSVAQTAMLDFDLALFRNQFAASDNYDYSSMLQAKWSGTGSGSEIIYGQTEGQVVHHSFPLPPYFKGEVELKFYTEIGQFTLDPSYLNSDDFVLLDNLQYKTFFSKTEEENSKEFVLVSPNPTQGMATIKSSGNMKSVRLHDISGRLLMETAVNTTSLDLNMQGWQNGFYLLKIELENGKMMVQKLVKMQ